MTNDRSNLTRPVDLDSGPFVICHLSFVIRTSFRRVHEKPACRTVAGAANVLAAVSSEGLSPSESTADSVKTLLQT
jgi:hypothetical protein